MEFGLEEEMEAETTAQDFLSRLHTELRESFFAVKNIPQRNYFDASFL